MGDYVGLKLGNYRLTSAVGQGGFADVYRGEHIYLKTQAAIKVMQTRLADKALENFLAEARMIARLDHPNIVRVLDFGIENETPFLVMSYASNGTLRQRHPSGGVLAPPVIVSYVKQLASGLQYAHERKIIHRDIKPENMLVADSGTILLSDFGLAIISHPMNPHNIGGYGTAGTTTYMAPEQFEGQPCQASDQYALGTVVYEWFCGTPPFTGQEMQIAARHLYTQPPSMRSLVPTLDPAIEKVVMRALAKEASERFASVKEFADALETACRAAPVQPYPLLTAPEAYDIPHTSAHLALDTTTHNASLADELTALSPVLPMPPEQQQVLSEHFSLRGFRPLPPATEPTNMEENKISLPSFLHSRPAHPRLTISPYHQLPAEEIHLKKRTEGKRRWLMLLMLLLCISGIIGILLLPILVRSIPRQPENVMRATGTQIESRATDTPVTGATQGTQPTKTATPETKPATHPTKQGTNRIDPRPTATAIQQQATAPPTPTSTVTTVILTAATPPTWLFTISPGHFDGNNCVQDNNQYRCTALLSLSTSYPGNLSWHASSTGTNASFNLPDGTMAPGTTQQIIIYIANECPAQGLLVFSALTITTSASWIC